MIKSEDPVARWEQYLQRVHPKWSCQRLDGHMLGVTALYSNEEFPLICGVEEDWYAVEYSFPFVAPEHRYAAVGELLHMVNESFPGGIFCLNYSTSLITCRNMHPYSGVIPDDGWLDQKIVIPLLETIIRYRTGLLATSYYDISPRVALPLSAMDMPFIPPSDSPNIWLV